MIGANRELRVHRRSVGPRDQYGDTAAVWTPGPWIFGNLGTRTQTQYSEGTVVTVRELWARLPAGTAVGARDLIETRDGTKYRVDAAAVRHDPFGRPFHVSVELSQDGVESV